MSDAGRLGREAEDAAARYLIERGFTIVTRNFRVPGGELDLVALDGEVLVFVEVKSRTTSQFPAEAALDAVKVARVVRAAEAYRVRMGERSREERYDLVCLDPEGIRHYPDAFRP